MKLRLRIIVPLVVGVGLLLAGGYAGRQEFTAWRQAHLIKQARQFLEAGESRKALLCLGRALRHNPDDAEACRLMASLAETTGSTDALVWRYRVLELAPQSPSNRFALAQTALNLGYPSLAARTLDEMHQANKATAAYQNAAGTVAMALHEPARAEAHFREAARFDPQNDVPQFNLAIIHLHQTNAVAREESLSVLRRITNDTTNSALRRLALRALANEAMRSQQFDTALELVTRLLSEPAPAFCDRLLQLDVLRQAHNPEFQPAMTACGRAADNPSRICEFATWQMDRLSPAAALNWLRRMPAHTQTNQPTAVLVAECLTLMQNWEGLNACLGHQDWGQWEFLRHGFNSLGLRKQGLIVAAGTEWDWALRTAGSRKVKLTVLFRLATQWRLSKEKEEVLWALVQAFPSEKWAFDELSQMLYDSGQTRSLLALYQLERKRSPSDLTIKNNLALTGLLLDAKEVKPHELARDTFQQAPTNAFYASTYAFSLYLQQRNLEALQIMERLDPKALQNPSIAGYYGLLLKAAGKAGKARTCFEQAAKAPLLPEERELFERAKSEILLGKG